MTTDALSHLPTCEQLKEVLKIIQFGKGGPKEFCVKTFSVKVSRSRSRGSVILHAFRKADFRG